MYFTLFPLCVLYIEGRNILPTTKDLFIIEIFLRHEWQQIDFWLISIVK